MLWELKTTTTTTITAQEAIHRGQGDQDPQLHCQHKAPIIFLSGTTKRRDRLVITHNTLSLLRNGLNLTASLRPLLMPTGWIKYSMNIIHPHQDQMRSRSLLKWRLTCTGVCQACHVKEHKDDRDVHRLYTKSYVNTTPEKPHRWQ